MPLKHDTETFLVTLLGLMIALAGVTVTFLPPLSVQTFPWVIAFVISLIYPLALYPMLKERRAEHEFRALHFVPMLILLVWLVLDLLASFRPDLSYLQEWFAWSWSMPVVAVAFLLLILFCLFVIRQRGVRIGVLLLLLAPFVILSQMSENRDWDRQLATLMWDGASVGTGTIASGGTSSNLAPSDDKAEEQWRMQLRRMERRRQRLAEEEEEEIAVRGARDSVIIAAGGIPELPNGKGGNGNAPPKLPSSGFGMEGLALVMVAGYCATIHRRAIRA